jgi:hypothetical protein
MLGYRDIIRRLRPQLSMLLFAVWMCIPSSAPADFIRNVPVGPIEFLPLDAKPTNMISAPITAADADDLVITYDIPALSIFNGEHHVRLDVEYTIEMIEPVRMRRERSLIACIPANSRDVHILRYDPDEKVMKGHWSGRFQNLPYKLSTADITNNGYDDLLVLLQDRTGVGFMRNNGDGTFRDIEFLFDDILVSMFQIVDLNGDGINDFILYDPIQNVLRFHYGFGRMIFSLERYLSFPASLNYFQALPIVEDAIHDLVAAFPDTKEYRVYLGDGLGRFSHIQSRSLAGRTYTFLFTDLFDNKRPDLVIAERETGILRLFRNDYKQGYEPAGAIQLPHGIHTMVVMSHTESSDGTLYLLDSENNRLIAIGLLPSVKNFLPPKLSLPSAASDMVTASLFGGELPELYILCKETGTISIYWYSSSFELNHSMITLPGNPDHLYVHRGPKDRTKLVVSDKNSDLITVVSIQWEKFEANMYGIPAMNDSEVIYLGLSPDNRFRFGTLAFTSGTQTPALSIFEQIASDEYIEHTITPIQEDRMLALDVVDITGNEAMDIVYMYRKKETDNVYLTSALNESAYVFRKQGSTLTLADFAATRGFLLSEDGSGNRSTSFIVYIQEDGRKNGRLLRVTGDRTGLLSLIDSDSGGKLIRSPGDIFLLPSMNNSFNDVVYYNTLTNQIELIQSNDDGSFTTPKPLLEVDDLSSFTVYSEPVGRIHMLVIGRKGRPYIEASRIEE